MFTICDQFYRKSVNLGKIDENLMKNHQKCRVYYILNTEKVKKILTNSKSALMNILDFLMFDLNVNFVKYFLVESNARK